MLNKIISSPSAINRGRFLSRDGVKILLAGHRIIQTPSVSERILKAYLIFNSGIKFCALAVGVYVKYING